MARQRFATVFQGNFLNTYASPVASGLVEPITGAAMGSQLTLGGFEELTRSEALKLSDTSVGTLLEGTYQLVYMNASASFGANLKRGQILFWKLGGTFVHEVTNVEPTGVSMIAGVYIGPVGTDSRAPSTTNPYFFMQAFRDGVANILFRTTLGNSGPAVGDAVFTAGAGAGTDNATADDIGGAGTPPTLANIANYIGRFLGVAETAPVGAAVSKVQLRGGNLKY